MKVAGKIYPSSQNANWESLLKTNNTISSNNHIINIQQKKHGALVYAKKK